MFSHSQSVLYWYSAGSDTALSPAAFHTLKSRTGLEVVNTVAILL